MHSSQKIGLTTATIIGMNAMIGAGIFSTPTKLLSYVGPAGILAYLFVVIAVWFMASSFARLGQLFPTEGSFYTYARQWGGHSMGLVSSGSYILGIVIAICISIHLHRICTKDILKRGESLSAQFVAVTDEQRAPQQARVRNSFEQMDCNKRLARPRCQ